MTKAIVNRADPTEAVSPIVGKAISMTESDLLPVSQGTQGGSGSCKQAFG
jgi:hypothetical protein